ncbi:phosphodiester glycosidase family protein [Nocardiopsis sediminis]|uniref:Phosphodiester glycosidase family protein n=1 Tax=Nocardiopsis sediminis TaxID=1778267 RepID=A0ABV8FKY5_9ACTN
MPADGRGRQCGGSGSRGEFGPCGHGPSPFTSQEAALSPQPPFRAVHRFAICLLVPLLALGPHTAASADPRPPGAPYDPAADVAAGALDASSHAPLSAPLPGTDAPAAGDAAADPVTVTESSEQVAPGVDVGTVRTVDAQGWQRSNVLSIDLDEGARIGYLDAGHVAATAPVSEMADAAGAVAAVNGGYFDINNSGAPLGGGVRDGEVVVSPQEGWELSATFDASGIGRIQDLLFEGTAELPSGEVALDALNSAALGTGEIGGYTALWGDYPRTRAVRGADYVTEVLVVDGRVASVSDTAGEGDIPADATVLLGREDGAATLAGLAEGDPVGVAFSAAAEDGDGVRTAVGGRHLLVASGAVQEVESASRAARTAIGFSADGRRVIIVTADGAGAGSRAATLPEMGERLVAEGADIGLELDGGGSSTLVARPPGASSVQVRNVPNDGEERPVPNGLAVYAPESSGRAHAFRVATAIDPATAPTASPVPGGRPDRVFSGLTRVLTATAHDEALGPVADPPRPRWSASRGEVDDGVFRAGRPGTATVTARSGRATGDIDLHVLGEAVRLAADTRDVNLTGEGATGTFGIVGYDEHGNSAPIEPADVELDYDTALLDIAPGDDGRFTATARADAGAAVVTARVGDLTAPIGVSVGVDRHEAAAFDDAAEWRADSARGTAAVAPADGRNGAGLRLSYDFSLSTGTRTAYAYPPAPLGVPGRTRAVGISVYGAGRGEWTAFTVVDATGRAHSVYGPHIDWSGWREIEIPVPDALPQPVTVSRFYTIETSADRSYTGEVVLDDLYLQAAPALDVPPGPQVRDDLVATGGDVGGADWRFAVMSDAQFVAADPDSALVAGARRTLREIRAARPDFLVIAGDFVDEASDADFELARRILDEELEGELPVHYVPGNHEVMGASIDGFTEHFGDPVTTFDHEGTRFITLDSSMGTLRAGSAGQIPYLRDRLADARDDPAVDSVAVVAHHPPRDPLPAQNSQLADRNEAALIEGWLADFQHDTGKGAVFIGGHVGAFNASSVDGVPYLVNGNAAKPPGGGTDEGGFSGWTLLGVDRIPGHEQRRAAAHPYAGGPDWISAQIRPHVDDLSVSAPERLAVGETAGIGAELTQADRTVRVAYPVGADWSGGEGVHIGPVDGDRPRRALAVFDPATGELAALREGEIMLSVEVNGVTARTEVDLVP